MIDTVPYLTAVVGDVIDVIYEPEDCVSPREHGYMDLRGE